MISLPTPLPDSIAIVGAGAWGTSLAAVLAERYRRISLWVFEADLAARMIRTRENAIYLPGVRLPDPVLPTASVEEALAGQAMVVVVVPSHVFRPVLERARGLLDPQTLLVSATKGIEVSSLFTMSQVMRQVLPSRHHARLAVSFRAQFCARSGGATSDGRRGCGGGGGHRSSVQHALSGGPLRVYASTDPLGVELGGAIKNVIAIAAGVVDGLELGTNARAALVTRGLAEITRLGLAMGAQAGTFAGLAGMGDLILTCTGDLSRNRSLGRALAAAPPGRVPGRVPARGRGGRTPAGPWYGWPSDSVSKCRSVGRSTGCCSRGRIHARRWSG